MTLNSERLRCFPRSAFAAVSALRAVVDGISSGMRDWKSAISGSNPNVLRCSILCTWGHNASPCRLDCASSAPEESFRSANRKWTLRTMCSSKRFVC